MPSATMTSKGQITLPASIREKLRLVPGSKVDFEEQANGDVLVKRKATDISELYGVLKPADGRVASIEDMDRAIMEAMADKLARSRY